MRRIAGLLLVLAGCRPTFYELVEGAVTAGDFTSMPEETGMNETAEAPTGAPQPGPCGDGEPGDGEADVDCGGACPPCGAGGACKIAQDCESALCVAGVCAPAPACESAGDCPPQPCRAASCSPLSMRCVYTDLDGEVCTSADLCVEGGVCEAGQCVGAAKDCSAFDGPCAIGFCNPQTGNCGVEAIADGEPCESPGACVAAAVCDHGACVGKPPPPLLLTDFAQPDGWQVDPPWAIGPATPSNCAEIGVEDPELDHSPGPDNMLAGAAIGGCIGAGPMPPLVCLTSPLKDTNVRGPLSLSYWSQLSAAPAPAGARVEVWAQGAWQPLFDTKGEPVAEPGWTLHVFDLTPYQGPGLRVRFCHHAPEPGSPSVAGWSVDDVYVGAPGCEPW